MKKEIIINSTVSETRISILEDGRLAELFVERPENERMVGDIYLGKVVNVVLGLQAAFVNIGHPQDAFLHFSDIGNVLVDYKVFADLNGSRNNSHGKYGRPVPKEGQEILVQIIKEPINKKGARVTTEISIPGRFLVLVPKSDAVGVSKKINRVKEKRRLKKIVRGIKPDGFGLIVRTVAENQDEKALKADLDNLIREWKKIQKKLRGKSPPSLIHKDIAMASSVIRDLFTSDVQKLVLDNKKLYKQISGYLKDVAPSLYNRVKYYGNHKPIFDAYGIEADIEKGLSRKVWTPSGGYIIFDHTEALVAVDVNSGKFLGRKEPEANILKINLEAAKEIARQLRLRDMGGLIIIDFIDMTDPANKKKLYEHFRRELRKDRAQANITPISEFGLIEMTRERVRPSLLYTFSESCPTCDGTGRVVSKTTVLTRIERAIKRLKSECREWSLQLVVHPSIAHYLTSGFNNKVRRMMWKYRLKIEVLRNDGLRTDQFKIILKKSQQEVTDQFLS
ncbi:MAG: ribonuclease E/G [bacterium]